MALPRLDIIDVWQGVNNWTWMHGAHQLRWGADIHRNMEDLFTVNAHTSGYFDFNQAVTGTPNVANSGISAASFMLGLPDTVSARVYSISSRTKGNGGTRSTSRMSGTLPPS